MPPLPRVFYNFNTWKIMVFFFNVWQRFYMPYLIFSYKIFLKILFFLYVWMFLPTSMFVYHVHAVLTCRGQKNWSYRSVVSYGCWTLNRFLCTEVSLQSQPFSSYSAISYSMYFLRTHIMV